ncbi:hypothetical protein [Jidongwangia harbinensis]|uniref:hypothetical protein n=1 Tax=Jidongwangia harbinensis TaxID=2878561 RepID=UPI001CD92673|nr:hypothetical protein [Jidongwangia harbinensis]MCA2214218.1 hypothetical protein [Jidongwangia harbinensis]
MHRPSIRHLVTAGLLALAVVATAAGPATASPAATRGGPSGVVLDGPAGTVLSVEGAGPYRIGARQEVLAAAGLLDWVAPQPGCDVVHAGATGDWAGVILLAFRNGRLVEVGTATTPPTSPAGASVGMSWSQLEDIYGSRGDLVHNPAGEQGYAVRIGSRVELYTGHPIRAGVGYFQVGPANFVLRNFVRGPAC